MFPTVIDLTYALFAGLGAWLVLRTLVNSVTTLRRRNSRERLPVAIAAKTGSTGLLQDIIATSGSSHFKPVVVFDEGAEGESTRAGLPVVDSLDLLRSLVRKRRIKELWLLGHPAQPPSIDRYVREFRHDFVNIRLIPDLHDFALASPRVVSVHGQPAINLVASPLTPGAMWPKRVFDWVFAALVLLFIAPMLLVIAVAVRLSSPGPVFFRQMRKGVDGNEFAIYKFRTMRQHVEHAGQVTQARRGDPRITRVGAFLRKTSLDELPQFINVLKGQMSVVGPRPHAVEHDELYKDLVEDYMYRYRIKPGITGWAQVNGFRGETDRIEKMEARVVCDLYYIQHWSFWLDIKIIGITLVKGFISKTAY